MGNIRKPAVAGQFYTENSNLLDETISNFFANYAKKSSPDLNKKIRAIISPHAGYVYSGETAADTFYTTKNFSYKQAVILAPSHHSRFEGIALSNYTGYETPLGVLKSDQKITQKLLNSQYFTSKNNAHENEHAIEVQLPFLQNLSLRLALMV